MRAVPFEDARDEARDALARQAWGEARAAYAAADAAGELSPAELEEWGLAAVLTGEYVESEGVRERAHYAHLDAGDVDGAARVAFWLGLALVTLRGEMARGGGWFARMGRVLADAGITDSVWAGHDLVTAGMRAFFAGQPELALGLHERALAVADRFADTDLRVLAGNGHGQALIACGELATGLAELDETMVLATTGSAHPQAVGLVCCAVINACVECMDVRRTAEWTDALTRWCDPQQGLVPFQGQCAVHRVELHQLRGRWDGAQDELRNVLAHVERHPSDHSAGMAYYQHGELCRVRGDHAGAEAAYREALRHGRDPQPGLALVRLAQGRPGPALQAIRRALDEPHVRRVARTHLLAAGVECGLAAGELEFARGCADELAGFAAGTDSALLAAVAAGAQGSLALAERRPGPAATALREALGRWFALDAPYDAAGCRIRIAQACRLLGDEETAELELDAARLALLPLCGPDETQRLLAGRIPEGPRGGAAGLTARELEVLRLLATGASNRGIAEALVLSDKTVARHVANIFAKIGVSSRAAATAYAHERRLA